MNFVDTHCHPYFDNFDDPESLLAEAAALGIDRIIAVGTTLVDSQKAISFAQAHKNVWASGGVHPHDAEGFNQKSTEEFKSLLKQPKVIAVGEIGLDFYKDYSPRDAQKSVLKAQIEAGLDSGLPFIFHVREAFEDFFKIIDRYPRLPGVVHSFSAQPKELEQILERGLYVGLNGIMTFTKDEQQLQSAKQVPANRLLLETDAPFLAPKPFRGKTCEPKHLLATAEFLAELRGEQVEELANYTTKNAMELFKIS